MRKILISSLMMFLGIASGFSQSHVNHQCATDLYNDNLILQDNTTAAQRQQYLQELTRIAEFPADDALNKKAVRVIPVVFHVIHQYGDENISKEQILDQLRVLNEDFSRTNADKTSTRQIFQNRSVDCEVQFKLATKDPDGNCTDGITRTYSTLTDGGDDLVKNLIRWDTKKYLNVWVIKRIVYGGGDGTTLGYATFPYNVDQTKDGIVMRADRVGTIGTSVQNGMGRTLTHEVGHYLGLYHTFQNGCGGSCSTTGDRICDTPPVSEPSFGCPLSNNTCTNDIPDEPDMIENYMDYANGNCMNAFTSGQKTVITFVLNNYRQILWSAENLASTGVNSSPTCAPVADFQVKDNVRRICAGSNVTLQDLSWNGEVVDYEWTIEGGSPQVSTFASPIITFNQPGRYRIKLKVSNSAGFDTITKEEIIQVVPQTSEIKTPYVEDFENKTEFEKDWITDEGVFGWQYTTSAFYSGRGALVAAINVETPVASDFYIYLPPIDMTAFTGMDPAFSFRAAYALPESGATGEFLYLEGSTDCGKTWKNIYVWLGRSTLKSTSLAQPNWYPQLPEDWHVLSVKLNKNGFESSPNLFLRIRARSNSGNSIYIDDVNIDRYALSIGDQPAWIEEITLAPNPSSGMFSISFVNPTELQSVSVTDQLGRLVREIAVPEEATSTVEVKDMDSGIYFVRITDKNGNSHIKKIIITKTL